VGLEPLHQDPAPIAWRDCCSCDTLAIVFICHVTSIAKGPASLTAKDFALNTLAICGIWFALLGAAPEGSLSGHAGFELQYSGSLSAVPRQGNVTLAKQFDAYVVVQNSEGGRTAFYVVNEQGGGSWAWPERFGRLNFDSENRRLDGRPLHVLQEHDGSRVPVELPNPVFEFASKLKADATWTSGKFSYEVRKKETVNKKSCWRVEAKDNFGRRESLWIEEGGSLIVATQKRLFMGRGDEYELKLDLAASRPLTTKVLDQLNPTMVSLLDLQASLKRQSGETKAELAEPQLKLVKDALPALEKQADGTSLKTLTTSIARDASAQSQRADNIASIAKKLVGQDAAEFNLTTLTQTTVNNKSQAGRITVLHFWDYKDTPLEEPYGQVGYLDYIHNRRKQYKVDVIGVAVNEGFAKSDTSSGALRSVRKLRDFMNLGYAITTDSGETLKRFGDPRSLGAKLPVWVVIDPDGKVVHYNVGLYAVNPDEGLKELDTAILALMRKQRAKQ